MKIRSTDLSGEWCYRLKVQTLRSIKSQNPIIKCPLLQPLGYNRAFQIVTNFPLACPSLLSAASELMIGSRLWNQLCVYGQTHSVLASWSRHQCRTWRGWPCPSLSHPRTCWLAPCHTTHYSWVEILLPGKCLTKQEGAAVESCHQEMGTPYIHKGWCQNSRNRNMNNWLDILFKCS